MREHLARLARELALPASGLEPDWGIELADPVRLQEVLRFYAAQETDEWSPWVQAEYADLVFQSAEEVLGEGLPVPENDLREFADRMAMAAPDRVRYWASLEEGVTDPWHMTGLLRSWGHGSPR